MNNAMMRAHNGRQTFVCLPAVTYEVTSSIGTPITVTDHIYPIVYFKETASFTTPNGIYGAMNLVWFFVDENGQGTDQSGFMITNIILLLLYQSTYQVFK